MKHEINSSGCVTAKAHKHPKYTSVGSYPLYYLVNNWKVLCAECVDDLDPDIDDVDTVTPHVNWESEIYCDECSRDIESAYSVPSLEQ